MRGAHIPPADAQILPGIIPADAGSTTHFQIYSYIPPDHPRGCGEHSGDQTDTAKVTGSSPRMRGAPCGIDNFPTLTRIIPADAGSTRQHGLLRRMAEDHPRGCGEHLTADGSHVRVRGSSPRMRGARCPYFDCWK